MPNTSKNIVIAGGAILLCYMLLGSAFKKERSLEESHESDPTVLFIDDIPISKNEYLLFLQSEIAITYNHFYLNYGAQPSEGFWSDAYDGIRPIDFIKQKTDAKLQRIKTVQNVAAEMNVITPFSYEEFLTHWKQENEERRNRKSAGGIVYGPVNVDKREYYDYLFSNLKIRLKEQLNQKVFKPSETELKNHYEEIKEEYFLYAPVMPIEYLLLDESSLPKAEIDQLVEAAETDIQNGIPMASYKNRNPVWTYGKLDLLDSVPSYGEENHEAMLKDKAIQLEPGELQILSVDYQCYLFRLARPLRTSYRPFEGIKDQVLYDYQAFRYEELIEQQMGEIHLEKNNTIYDEISID